MLLVAAAAAAVAEAAVAVVVVVVVGTGGMIHAERLAAVTEIRHGSHQCMYIGSVGGQC